MLKKYKDIIEKSFEERLEESHNKFTDKYHKRNDSISLKTEEESNIGLHEYIISCKFKYKCPLDWYSFKKTDNENIRFCEVCQKDVHKIENIEEFYECSKNNTCIMIKFKKNTLMGYLIPDTCEDEIPY